MALTRAEINERSNQKRGIKSKSFKLHVDDIELIQSTAKKLNISQTKLITEGVKLFIKQQAL